jgi:hypothetical protein
LDFFLTACIIESGFDIGDAGRADSPADIAGEVCWGFGRN